MQNLKLLITSLGVIAVLAGIPHLLANQSKSTQNKVAVKTPPETLEPSKETHNDSNDFLLGKWKVQYDSEEFRGAVINEIKESNEKMIGVTIAYLDEYGNSQKANDTILEITLEKSKTYTGIYRLDYEGERYKIPCEIRSISGTQLQLSYDYYGYADTEIWNKIP
ncbi:hypothetical protein [Flagellimonas sp.]|uniref:hypothetical protein n=1 Tax=Flagellimonas sp. TaxID=2058762 RepID=UPI003B5B03AE